MIVRIQEQLLGMIEAVATALGEDLRQQLVFVGGCSTAVLLTDEIVLEDVRSTDDVDLIVDLSGMAQWMQLQQKLEGKGFTISSQDDVICRMRLGNIKVDFMPDDERILGFGNRWYRRGIETSMKYLLPSGLEIKHLSPPLFIATKLEAYLGRGGSDPLASHDLEDILIVIDGRQELTEEMRSTDSDVREFVAAQFRNLLNHRDFEHFLHGNIRGPDGRVDLIRERVEHLANNENQA